MIHTLLHNTHVIIAGVLVTIGAVGAAFARATSTKNYICEWCHERPATHVCDGKEHVCATCIGLPL